MFGFYLMFINFNFNKIVLCIYLKIEFKLFIIKKYLFNIILDSFSYKDYFLIDDN